MPFCISRRGLQSYSARDKITVRTSFKQLPPGQSIARRLVLHLDDSLVASPDRVRTQLKAHQCKRQQSQNWDTAKRADKLAHPCAAIEVDAEGKPQGSTAIDSTPVTRQGTNLNIRRSHRMGRQNDTFDHGSYPAASTHRIQSRQRGDQDQLTVLPFGFFDQAALSDQG